MKIINYSPEKKYVKRRQLGWLGHALRWLDENTKRLYALYAPTHGRPKRGRPRLQYWKYVEQLIGL